MDIRNILLADVHPDINQTFIAVFTEPDYHLKITQTGSETLASVFSSKPDVLVLDSSLDEETTPEILRTLRANSITFGIPVLVILPEDSQAKRDQFGKVGQCDFVVKPVTPDRIKNTIESLIRGQNLFGSRMNTKIISFCGARGGCGATTVAVNTAIALRETGKSVVLMELANYFSGIKPALNVATHKTIPFMMGEKEESLTPESIREFLEEHSSGIKAIPSIATISDMEMMNAKAVDFMRRNIAPVADIAVIDGGYGITDAVLELIDISDHVIFVATLDMPSLYNLELINQVLDGTRIDTSKCMIVFNHIHPVGELPESAVRDVHLKLPILGFIPHHGVGFNKSMNEGKPYIKEYPKTSSSKALRTIATTIQEMSETPVGSVR